MTRNLKFRGEPVPRELYRGGGGTKAPYVYGDGYYKYRGREYIVTGEESCEIKVGSMRMLVGYGPADTEIYEGDKIKHKGINYTAQLRAYPLIIKTLN